MRLTPDQVQAIRHAAQRVLGNGAQVRVFGSMAIDNLKGGDIDLLCETDGEPRLDLNRASRKRMPHF